MWWCEKRQFGNRYEMYFVDIACLQETKITNGLNSKNITCFPTKDAYGLGFIVNEKWKNNIHKQWGKNDGIAIIQFNLPKIKERKKYANPICKKWQLVKKLKMKLKIKNNCNLITITNFYVPHFKFAKKKVEDSERFYKILDRLGKKFKNKSSIVIVAGDINATAEKKINETCVGRHSKRYKNDNGDYLINFCQNNELLLTNK